MDFVAPTVQKNEDRERHEVTCTGPSTLSGSIVGTRGRECKGLHYSPLERFSIILMQLIRKRQ
jgi:hypothetical protein